MNVDIIVYADVDTGVYVNVCAIFWVDAYMYDADYAHSGVYDDMYVDVAVDMGVCVRVYLYWVCMWMYMMM